MIAIEFGAIRCFHQAKVSTSCSIFLVAVGLPESLMSERKLRSFLPEWNAYVSVKHWAPIASNCG